jgi:dsDNA-binding SOS-regulon protein
MADKVTRTTTSAPVEPVKMIPLTIYFADQEELDAFHKMLDTMYQQNRHLLQANTPISRGLSAALWAILVKKKRT